MLEQGFFRALNTAPWLGHSQALTQTDTPSQVSAALGLRPPPALTQGAPHLAQSRH